MVNSIRVLIIVVTYNGQNWVDRCFGSLKSSTIPLDIICIDNMSSDNTLKKIKENYQDVILIESKKNLGFGKANNIGLKYAIEKGYEYVFLLNQDASVEPTTIGKLIEIAQSNPEYGIVSPIHLNGESTTLDLKFSTYLEATTCPQLLSDLLLGKTTKHIYSTSFVNAAAWLLPISTIEKIGGFDPVFYHYGEDDNYCQRVLFHGSKIGIVPNTYISHDRPQVLNSFNPFDSLKHFERYFKVKVANVNVQQFNKQFEKEIGKIKKNLYASLVTLNYSNYFRWLQFLKLAKQLKPEIQRSFEINRRINRNYLD